MFFTNEKLEKSIVRATMAGTDKKLFRAVSPGDLAVDKARNRLYWTDTIMKRIKYADLTGTVLEVRVRSWMYYMIATLKWVSIKKEIQQQQQRQLKN